jgi:lipopolysaccharide export system permease protein
MLNITQLNLTIDSLEVSLEEKQKSFANGYLNNYTFYTSLDTSINESDTNKIAGDLLSSFDKKDQLKIVENALTTARNLKKSVGYYNADFSERAEYIRKHKVIWHKKFTLSFACLILFFIGAPLGAIIRRGGLGLPVVVSVIFFILYHIISMIGEKSAKQDAMDIVTGMWLSSAVILPLGIYLTYKATVDAPIMDREIWNKLFDKLDIVKKLIRKKQKGK